MTDAPCESPKYANRIAKMMKNVQKENNVEVFLEFRVLDILASILGLWRQLQDFRDYSGLPYSVTVEFKTYCPFSTILKCRYTHLPKEGTDIKDAPSFDVFGQHQVFYLPPWVSRC